MSPPEVQQVEGDRLPQGQITPRGRGGFVPWQPGQSGNPGGRPKVQRTLSKAYAELIDMPGPTSEDAILQYMTLRGNKLCASDHGAIAMFRSMADPGNKNQTKAAMEIADRTEGKVVQQVQTVSVSFVVPAPMSLCSATDGLPGLPEFPQIAQIEAQVVPDNPGSAPRNVASDCSATTCGPNVQ